MDFLGEKHNLLFYLASVATFLNTSRLKKKSPHLSSSLLGRLRFLNQVGTTWVLDFKSHFAREDVTLTAASGYTDVSKLILLKIIGRVDLKLPPSVIGWYLTCVFTSTVWFSVRMTSIWLYDYMASPEIDLQFSICQCLWLSVTVEHGHMYSMEDTNTYILKLIIQLQLIIL